MSKNNELRNGSPDENGENTAENNVENDGIIGSIFKRVIEDESFKELLLSDSDAALAEYKLSDVQVTLIKSLSRDDLDKLTPENLEEFFAADAAVYTPDETDMLDLEAYDLTDFEEMD